MNRPNIGTMDVYPVVCWIYLMLPYVSCLAKLSGCSSIRVLRRLQHGRLQFLTFLSRSVRAGSSCRFCRPFVPDCHIPICVRRCPEVSSPTGDRTFIRKVLLCVLSETTQRRQRSESTRSPGKLLQGTGSSVRCYKEAIVTWPRGHARDSRGPSTAEGVCDQTCVGGRMLKKANFAK